MRLRSLSKIEILAAIALVMLAVQLINALSGYALNQFGLLPRTQAGLINLFFSPWIHSNWGHLFNNLIPFLILSGLIINQSIRYYLLSSAIIIVSSGLLLWLFGRYSYHIGASGWVFGLWGLLVTNAFRRRRLSDIIIGIAVVFYYGTSMVMGILPINPQISFEGHIAGGLGGCLAAWLLHRPAIKT
jgi:membrane associated rhomboid family serine protease